MLAAECTSYPKCYDALYTAHVPTHRECLAGSPACFANSGAPQSTQHQHLHPSCGPCFHLHPSLCNLPRAGAYIASNSGAMLRLLRHQAGKLEVVF